MLNPQRPSLRGQGWRGSRPDITWELEPEPQLHSAPGIFFFLTCVFKLSFYRFLFYYFFPLSLLHSPPKYFSLPQAGQPGWNAAGLHPRVPGAALPVGQMRLGLASRSCWSHGQGSAWGSPPVTGART